jgi:hypothetical protein
MDSDGSCSSSLSFDKGDSNTRHCSAYCEVRNYFFYGKEVVFTEFSGCRANSACSFVSSKALTISQTYTFNVGAKVAKRQAAEVEKVLEFGFDLVRPF